MKYVKDFRNLCTPASVYLAINVIIFVVIAVQNFGNIKQYCVGQYKCNVPNTFVMFLFKAVYILFWTFLLNAVCRAGYREVSWFLVILPIILMFVILGIVLINGRVFEGMKSDDIQPTPTICDALIRDKDLNKTHYNTFCKTRGPSHLNPAEYCKYNDKVYSHILKQLKLNTCPTQNDNTTSQKDNTK